MHPRLPEEKTMSYIVNVAQMRAIETEADRKGVTFERMMDRAGEAVFAHAVGRRGSIEKKRVIVLCGSGNNGGDGLAAAAHFARAGAEVRAFLIAERKESEPRWQAAADAGVVVEPAEKESRLTALLPLLDGADILIDAVLGTGTKLPLRTPIADLLAAVKARLEQSERRPFVVAVDCPSGLDCDTGEVSPQTIPADLTVTLGAAKAGLLAFPGAEFVGSLIVADIGLGGDLDSLRVPGPVLADRDLVRGWLRPRPRDSHKGTFGRVIVVGGSINYPGAPILAGLGAYRSGAGLVTLAVPRPVYPAAIPLIPEATWIAVPEDSGGIASGTADVLRPEIAHAQAIVIGPGLGREKSTAAFFKEFLQNGQGKRTPIGFGKPEKTEPDRKIPRPPMVVDADALRMLSEIDGWPGMLPPGSILTPHPGEMAALTGLSKEEIQKDRPGIAIRFAKTWNAVVVLKGAFSAVAAPDGRCAIEPFATPALARAGTGDVLAGTIGGLVAQGMESWEAAVLGSYLHGRAGELAAGEVGAPDSVLAGDVARCLAKAIAELRGNL
jgi:NAD(P)H-hydrate epimerase